MKAFCLLMAIALAAVLAGCNPPPPTVEQFNAANAVRAKKCADQGYKLGSKDNATCVELAVVAERQAQQTNNDIAIGVVGAVISDARLKRDIVFLGRLDGGVELVSFRYAAGGEKWVGVIAQQVAALRPDAVLRGSDGYLRVDYARLGLRLMTWDDWSARQRRQAQR